MVPGMLMAAARLNLPTIFCSGGPMLAGKYKDKRLSEIKTDKINLKDYQTYKYEMESKQDSDEIKVFVWDGISSIEPISQQIQK